MNNKWKKILAKEWLWFIGTVIITLVIMTIIYENFHYGADEFWEDLLPGTWTATRARTEFVRERTFLVFILIYAIRFTLLSIKQLIRGRKRKKNENNSDN